MSERSIFGSLGLLVLRVGLGFLMMYQHGWDKLAGFAEKAAAFPDPLGFGPKTSLALAVFAEFFCSILLILGIGTRLATIPLIVTMSVAAFIVHADDPLQTKELALVYLTGFVALLIAGGGSWSLGAVAWRAMRGSRRNQEDG
jgi:putative oxidoreductase